VAHLSNVIICDKNTKSTEIFYATLRQTFSNSILVVTVNKKKVSTNFKNRTTQHKIHGTLNHFVEMEIVLFDVKNRIINRIL